MCVRLTNKVHVSYIYIHKKLIHIHLYRCRSKKYMHIGVVQLRTKYLKTNTKPFYSKLNLTRWWITCLVMILKKISGPYVNSPLCIYIHTSTTLSADGTSKFKTTYKDENFWYNSNLCLIILTRIRNIYVRYNYHWKQAYKLKLLWNKLSGPWWQLIGNKGYNHTRVTWRDYDD